MEWQQLEYFCLAGHLEHMTAAAKHLSVTQSALSRSISRLEKELGVPLFDRHGRSIKLNRYGRLFLKHVDSMMREFEAAQQELQWMTRPESDEIAVGFLQAISPHTLPELLQAYRMESPDPRFQFYQNDAAALLEQLRRKEIDLCMVEKPSVPSPSLQWVRLWSEPMYIAVPIDHRLAKKSAVRLEEIAEEQWIAFKAGHDLRTEADRVLSEAGVAPQVVFEGDELQTVISLVSSGLGVAIVPGLRGLDKKKLALLPITWPVCTRQIGIAWIEGRSLSPSTLHFLQYVIDYFHKNRAAQEVPLKHASYAAGSG
ncbi:LysR family transcriptional regulator [Paenibacillus rigui]|uniref:LysR family transcriptional regulator n=1 Tax=Paenibacillus rigui TaxID=554312 RepID=A0A229UV38_9BACL|nr:LysR family transcriptional regulator [Paenibacillus rigui]OXM87467.1 LysR family transcriptional regulator [Paenibacillus rigui]